MFPEHMLQLKPQKITFSVNGLFKFLQFYMNMVELRGYDKKECLQLVAKYLQVLNKRLNAINLFVLTGIRIFR